MAELAVSEVKELRGKVAAYEQLRELVKVEVDRAGGGARKPKVDEAERRVLAKGIARARLARKDLSPAARDRVVEQAVEAGAISEEEAEEYRREGKR